MICEFIKLEWDTRKESGIEINGLEYKTSMTLIPYQATMIARNQEVCQLDGRQNKDTFDLSIAFSNQTSYLVRFWQQSSNIGTIKGLASMVGKMVKEKSIDGLNDMLPKIYDANNQQVGDIQHIPVQDGLQSYDYYKLRLNGTEVNCYHIGIGKDVYFCMYNNENQILATVSKRVSVKNGKSRYTMYIINDSWFPYIAIMTSIMHQMYYEDSEIKGLGNQGYKLNTFQEKLKAMYQPNFIPQIIAKEGSANLPENMSLVQEKVKESQNTTLINTKKIGLIVFIVAFVLLFGYLLLFGK